MDLDRAKKLFKAWEVLGVGPTSDKSAVDAAAIKVRKHYHPDHNGSTPRAQRLASDAAELCEIAKSAVGGKISKFDPEYKEAARLFNDADRKQAREAVYRQSGIDPLDRPTRIDEMVGYIQHGRTQQLVVRQAQPQAQTGTSGSTPPRSSRQPVNNKPANGSNQSWRRRVATPASPVVPPPAAASSPNGAQSSRFSNRGPYNIHDSFNTTHHHHHYAAPSAASSASDPKPPEAPTPPAGSPAYPTPGFWSKNWYKAVAYPTASLAVMHFWAHDQYNPLYITLSAGFGILAAETTKAVGKFTADWVRNNRVKVAVLAAVAGLGWYYGAYYPEHHKDAVKTYSASSQALTPGADTVRPGKSPAVTTAPSLKP